VTSTASSPPAPHSAPAKVAFAHPSEEQFARILTYYRISWEYEPRTFPIRWDEHGHVVESFTPDFYLPELEQYVELTTLKQSLVTRKNRKLRLLRRLHPGVKVKLFYRSDFEQLVGKYAVMGKVPTPARVHPRQRPHDRMTRA
jgi:hypoxanthine phosphoribosyltransferase